MGEENGSRLDDAVRDGARAAALARAALIIACMAFAAALLGIFLPV